MFVRIKNIKSKAGIMYPYAYLCHSYWDKNEKKVKQKVVQYLGKVDIGKIDYIKSLGKECKFCPSKENLTIDHIIPLSKGGTNNPDNLQTLCSSCNKKKSNKVI